MFGFVGFIERMEEGGDDVGAGKRLSETEDVVGMMRIDSSKGVEFRVVFSGGLGRTFNMMDVNQSHL
ncbi:hypothetical protein, partial [Bacillus altitudinis]|uniref:hypothetical protein n=1 Tax=Bacillus altitudinis TaxID=293387 RepID=UPI001C92D298